MIGDADLDILKDTNSTPWLNDMVYQAATNLGYQSHFFRMSAAMGDDHIPFSKVGVPVVDIIDFDYGYHNVFWHTPGRHDRQAEPAVAGHHRRRGAGNDPALNAK